MNIASNIRKALVENDMAEQVSCMMLLAIDTVMLTNSDLKTALSVKIMEDIKGEMEGGREMQRIDAHIEYLAEMKFAKDKIDAEFVRIATEMANA